MLVLSRQREEVVMIGDDVAVTVVDIRGDKVRLGFEAPKNVPVHRREVFDAIKRSSQVKRTETMTKDYLDRAKEKLAEARRAIDSELHCNTPEYRALDAICRAVELLANNVVTVVE